MTTGQLVFYSGVGLLVCTILLAIVFIVKKPKYTPENGAIQAPNNDGTQRLRNGYPTDLLTIRRGTLPQDKTAAVEETEYIGEGDSTVFVPEDDETD